MITAYLAAEGIPFLMETVIGTEAARIGSELFEHLDAPVGRLGALDTWVGYNPTLEYETLPQVENLAAEMERLLNY